MKLRSQITKILAIAILTLMLINSSLLTIISTALEFIDVSKINAIVEIDLDKYVNFKIDNDRKGVMLSAKVKAGIEYKEDQEYKPLISTGIGIDLPKIEDKFPDNVEVVGISTKATNGSDNAKDFEYSYDKHSGKLKIIANNNQDDNGNIYSENVLDARDEYNVICYYDESCYSDKKTERDLQFEAMVKTMIQSEEDTIISNETSQNYKVIDDISGLISTNVVTTDIYNGYINSNNLNNTNYGTTYEENVNMQISYKNISDEINIVASKKFIDKNEKEISTEEIKYVSTKINKQEVLDYLGEDGFLQIIDNNGEVLKEINKDTEELEDGTVEVIYENEISSLTIKTSEPLKLGTLGWKNVIEIKDSMNNVEVDKIMTNYDITAIKNEKEVDEETNEVIKEEKIDIYNFSDNNIVDIKGSETRVDLSVDKTDWTNNVKNDVIFTATLVTNDNKYNLFKNPTIDISLPTEVEKVILGNVSLLYDDNLSVKSANVLEVNESKIIRIELDGIQDEYITNNMVQGANIIIPASIILNKNIENSEDTIKYSYYNETKTDIDYIKEQKQYKELNVNILGNIEKVVKKAVRNNNENSELSIDINAQVGNKILKNDDIVYENQIITYSVKITNNTQEDISNLSIIGEIPDGADYVTVNQGNGDDEDLYKLYEYVKDEIIKQKEITIDEIKANETIERFFEVEVSNLEDNITEKDIQSIITVYNNKNKIKEFSLNNKVNKKEIYARLVSGLGGTVLEDDLWQYYLVMDNVKGEVLQDIDILFDIPNYMQVVETGILTNNSNLVVDEVENNKLKMHLDEIGIDEKIVLKLYIRKDNLIEGVYEYQLEMDAEITGKNISEYNTNINRQVMYIQGIEISQTSEKEGKEIKYDEEIEYNVVIENVGKSYKSDATIIYIKDTLPKNVRPLTLEYENFVYNEEKGIYEKEIQTKDLSTKFVPQGSNSEDIPDIDINCTIPIGEKINLKIKAKADLVYEKTEIENNLIVKGNAIETKISNTIKNIILPYNYEEGEEPENPDKPDKPENPDKPDKPENPDTPDNPDNPDNPEIKYNISGTAWNDSNENGKRDSDEQLLEGINVKLFNAQTNRIVLDDNGNTKVVKTDSKGKYSFNNIEKGKYLVLFEYDSDKFELTKYKELGVAESQNSDVVLKEINIDGKIIKAGVTDILEVKDDIFNIDIGLVEKGTFDFSLEKYVTKVTVIDNKGTKEYNYNNSKLAKVDIPSKQIANTKIIIEYKLVVKNEGNVSGYVKELVDYLPDTLNFEDSLNKDWKVSNKDIVSDGLAEVKIEPGESKEINVVLTKQLNNNSIGSIINSAEISKTYNLNRLNDIDSKEKNRNTNEDDYSEAQVIISIKTGAVAKTIYFIAIVILVAFAILVKKKKIDIKKIIKFNVILLIGGIILTANISKAYTAEELVNLVVNDYNTYKNPGTIAVRSGSDTFATHDSDYSFYLNSDRIHCADNAGIYSMCGDGDHIYTLKSTAVDITSGPYYEGSSSNIYTDATIAGNVQLTKQDGYNLIGPYRIHKDGVNGENVSFTLYSSTGIVGWYQLMDTYWNNINGIPYDADFFFKVPSDCKEIIKIDLNINHSYSVNSTIGVRVVQNWTCDTVTGSHSHGCRNPEKAQPGERVYEETRSYPESGSATSSFVLPGAKLKLGNLEIKKVDKDTGRLLAGAKFRVSGPNGYNNEVTTGSNGVYTIRDLDLGVYTVTEIQEPNGYYTDASCIGGNQTYNGVNISDSIEVVSGNTVSCTFRNIKYGRIVVHKKSLYGGGGLAGAVFRLYDDSWTNVVGEVTTDKDGNATIERIKQGNYHLVEYKAPTGCWTDVACLVGKQYLKEIEEQEKICEDITINATNGGEYDTTFKNKESITITISKADVDSNEPIEGVGFIVEYTNSMCAPHSIGDVNDDGIVNNEDSDMIMNYAGHVIVLNEEQMIRADVNRDGQVNVKDAILIMGYIADKDKYDGNEGYITKYEYDKEKSNLEFSRDIEKAQVFYTNNAGEIIIANVPQGNYRIYEAKLDPEKDGGKYYDISEEFKPIYKEVIGGKRLSDKELTLKYKLGNIYGYEFLLEGEEESSVTGKKEANVYFTNKQRYVDISGFVWEDIAQSKESIRDNVYTENNGNEQGDKRAYDIEVKLINSKNSSIEKSMVTTEKDNGEYKFEKIEISKLDNYYIEFEYNGLKYTNVDKGVPEKSEDYYKEITKYQLAGDFDGNGILTKNDATNILKIYAGIIDLDDIRTFPIEIKSKIDINGDNVVNENEKELFKEQVGQLKIRIDVDNNGVGNALDAVKVLRYLQGVELVKYDINFDGKVDEEDYKILERYFKNEITLSFKEKLVANVYKRGDANGDGEVRRVLLESDDENDETKFDEVYIAKIAAGSIKVEQLSKEQFEMADIDENGKINAKDVSFLMQYYTEIRENWKDRNKTNKQKLQELREYLDKMAIKVKVINELSNTSKAVEKIEDRENFNKAYSSIIGGNSKEENITRGYSLNDKGITSNELIYTNDTDRNYSSSLVRNTGYSSKNEYVIAQKDSGSLGIKMTADTRTAGFKFKWLPGIKEIKYVNLGLVERVQPNMSIRNNIDAIRLSINGQEQRYPSEGIYESNGLDSLTAQFSSTYQRTCEEKVYNSYLNATKNSENKKLKVYAEYKIKIKNESSSKDLVIQPNQIINYSNKRINYKVDSVMIGEQQLTEAVTLGTQNGNKQEINIKGVKLEQGQTCEIGITLEIDINEIINWSQNKGEFGFENICEISSYSTFDTNEKIYAGIDSNSAPNNINSEKGFEKDYFSFEDDTDITQSILLTTQDSYSIEGFVFEDSAIDNDNNEKIGNGRYDRLERYLEEVKVELVEIVEENGKNVIIPAYMYKEDVIEDAIAKTPENGRYSFSELIPGNYRIRFTYGDGTQKIYDSWGNLVKSTYDEDDENSNIPKPVTTQDYKSTIITNSNTKDENANEKLKRAIAGIWNEQEQENNKDFYKYIDGQSIATDVYNKEEYSKYGEDMTDPEYRDKVKYLPRKNIDEKYYKIDYKSVSSYETEGINAYSPKMLIKFQPDEDSINGLKLMNFGIIERPRQVINLKKEIAYVKLILENGQYLINGDPRDKSIKMNYTTYPKNGILKAEVDSNLIKDSSLEITYEIIISNDSELDYDTEAYYKYGDKTNSDDKIVKAEIVSVVDYLDENLRLSLNQNNWHLKEQESEIKQLYENGKISEEVYNTIKLRKNIFINNNDSSILSLKPGTTDKVIMRAGKTLRKDEETTYKNYVELLEVANRTGRFYGAKLKEEDKGQKYQSYQEKYTPGNYVIDDENTHESDDNNNDKYHAQLTIMPPTGQNRIYYILGFSCLIILVGGIILIKKIVLK